MLPPGGDVCLAQAMRENLDTKAEQAAVKKISEGLKNGELSLVIDCHFPMAEVQDAIRYMESNQQIGKIVVNPKTGFQREKIALAHLRISRESE